MYTIACIQGPMHKVVIHKSCSDVSLLEQDIIDYVSTAYFHPKQKQNKKTTFFKRDIMQLFSADATI